MKSSFYSDNCSCLHNKRSQGRTQKPDGSLFPLTCQPTSLPFWLFHVLLLTLIVWIFLLDYQPKNPHHLCTRAWASVVFISWELSSLFVLRNRNDTTTTASITFVGCTTKISWPFDTKIEESHCSAISFPHIMLWNKVNVAADNVVTQQRNQARYTQKWGNMHPLSLTLSTNFLVGEVSLYLSFLLLFGLLDLNKKTIRTLTGAIITPLWTPTTICLKVNLKGPTWIPADSDFPPML